MAPVTATGVPKPEAPSKNAPKQKAISSSCSRRSSVTPPIVVCRVSNDAFLDRQPVEEDDVEHDPADREEAGDGAEHGRA